MMDVNGARPVSDDREDWRVYWEAHGMPWRTEPEIGDERQRFLSERRVIEPEIEQHVYPFKDITLSRADVEWLLATHSSCGVVGPVRWEANQSTDLEHRRTGLDLRGAEMRGCDLRNMPLAGLQGGLHRALDAVLAESEGVTLFQQRAAAIHLEGTNLSDAHFEGACLDGAHFEEALIQRACFEGATLCEAHFEWANLRGARLEGVNLFRVRFEGASLNEAALQRANLGSAHLEDALLNFARIDGADLRGAFLSSGTDVEGVRLDSAENGTVLLADVRWGGANLTAMSWNKVDQVGDEQLARGHAPAYAKPKGRSARLAAFVVALRANRQLANALRLHGLNEHADRFAYRAQTVRRGILLREGKLGPWLFSWLLNLLAGYGYRIERILITYVVTLSAFAGAYYVIGLPNEHATTLLQHIADSFQVSLTAIHGRLFFEQLGLGSTLTWVAAAESVCGIVIEAVFTSMLVQRFFAR